MGNPENPQPPASQPSLRTALLAGIVPLVVFTIAEETWGIVWGLVLGMAFGLGEILYQYLRDKKVQALTLWGNIALLVLGGISLLTQEGIWFKLQPAIVEAALGVVFFASWVMGKPLMVVMAKKQGAFSRMPSQVVPVMEKLFSGFTFRVSIFFLVFAALTVWVAIYESTRMWVLLKGVGFTISFLVYGVLEMLLMRRRLSHGPSK